MPTENCKKQELIVGEKIFQIAVRLPQLLLIKFALLVIFLLSLQKIKKQFFAIA